MAHTVERSHRDVFFRVGTSCSFSHPRNPTDAEAGFGVQFEDFANDLGLVLYDFVVRTGSLAFFHVSVAVGGAGKDIDRSRLGAITFPAARPFCDLRPFVFRYHALKLKQQLLFRGGCMGRLYKDNVNGMLGKFLYQQNLVRVLATQPVRLVDQYMFDLPFGSQIAQLFEPRAAKLGAAVTFIWLTWPPTHSLPRKAKTSSTSPSSDFGYAWSCYSFPVQNLFKYSLKRNFHAVVICTVRLIVHLIL